MNKETLDNLKLGQQGLITIEELRQKLKEGEALYLLDIRSKEDYEKGTIEGANHSEWESVVDMINEDLLPKDKDIIVFCYNGQSSMQIAMVLNLQGYNAYSLLDGIEGWKNNKKIDK